MSRESVLSGLAGRYKLTKEDLGGGPVSQLEVWSVEEKGSPASADFWEIAIKDGKVTSVITHFPHAARGCRRLAQLSLSFIRGLTWILARSQSFSVLAD